MAKTKPYRKDPSPAHTGLKKYERTFLNRKARRRKKQEKEEPNGDALNG